MRRYALAFHNIIYIFICKKGKSKFKASNKNVACY